MKCSKCNQEIEETSAFCPFCGAPVEKEEKTQQEEQDESIVQEETDIKDNYKIVTIDKDEEHSYINEVLGEQNLKDILPLFIK